MKGLTLFFLSLILFSFSYLGVSQENAKALIPVKVYSPTILIDKLSKKVKESSGLIFFRSSIWTLNDSGGKPQIYRLDNKSGKVVQVVSIEKGRNIDFEDLTQDGDFIYVGDFGNNFGNRKNLRIYKIAKKDIPKHKNVIVKAELIHFNYFDQKIFQRKSRRNNYDCEAITSLGDSLYLFTKDWDDAKTRVYALPKKAGKYTAKVLADFNADGLITAADYNTKNGMLSLLGYKDFVPFVWFFWDFNQNNFFDGKQRRFNLEDILGAQTEGVCFNDKGDLLISSENSYYPQRLYKISAQALKSHNNSLKVHSKNILDFVASYEKNKEEIRLEIKGLDKGIYTVEILNEIWKSKAKFSFMSTKGQKESIELDAKKLNYGMYYLRIEQKDKPWVRSIYLNK